MFHLFTSIILSICFVSTCFAEDTSEFLKYPQFKRFIFVTDAKHKDDTEEYIGTNIIKYSIQDGGIYEFPDQTEGKRYFNIREVKNILLPEGELVIINNIPYLKFWGYQIPDEQFAGALIPVGDYDEKNRVWTITYQHIDPITERLGWMEDIKSSYMRQITGDKEY